MIATEVIQKLNVLALARAADRVARVGSHVAGRAVSYGAVRGAVRGAAAGAVRGALQGVRETRRIRNAMRAARRFRTAAGRGYRDTRWANGVGSRIPDIDMVVGDLRAARAFVTRTSRAGRAGYAIGRHAGNAQSRLGAASRTLVNSFSRNGRRVASYWRANR